MCMRLKDLIQQPTPFNRRSNVNDLTKKIADLQLAIVTDSVNWDAQAYGAAHYSEQTAQIEYYCRLLWLAVPAKKLCLELNQQLAQKIMEGTNPQSPNYWQKAKDYDQRVVEMSAIAMALVEAPEIYWSPFSSIEQQNLALWLLSVNHLILPPNNWYWFRVLILTALQSVGVRIENSEFENDLNAISQMQLEQGWYKDGSNPVTDYYNPLAFQLYALMYCRWKPHCPRVPNLLKQAVQFAETYVNWFGTDGSQLGYGRSLNYRFAILAFWAELARLLPDHSNVALWRTLWTQGMNWWAEQPIWDCNGTPMPGFAYPNLLMSEFYTSSASPLLAFKAFNALALENDHPFWQSRVIPLNSYSEAYWINHHHQVWRNGGSYLISNAPGSSELRECADKYYKFAYSSQHGFCIDSLRWISQGWIGDNLLAIQHPDTHGWYGRKSNHRTYRVGDTLVSEWSPFTGCDVTTYQTLKEGKEIRIHRIESQRELAFIQTGYCVDAWRGWFTHSEPASKRIESEQLFSELALIRGPGENHCYPCAPNTNILYPHACVPAISGVTHRGVTELEVHVSAGSKSVA